MNAWKPKLTMKEKVCEALKNIAGYCLCVAMIEAMMVMFVLLA